MAKKTSRDIRHIPPAALAFLNVPPNEVKTALHFYRKLLTATDRYYEWKEGK